MIAFSPLLAKVSGQDGPPPRKLVDEAFSELQERMVPHGFVRSGRKRILSRSFGGAEESIGYSLGKYNERGIRAEFTIWMETSALPASRKIRWYRHDSVFCSETNGAKVLGTEIGSMTVWQYRYAVNLYPEFRREARIRKAVAKAERTSLAWFEARRCDAQLSSH